MPKTVDFAIVIYEGVEPIDIGAAYGVLSMAKRRAPDLTYVGVARSAGPVTCANGLVVHADYSFDSCPPARTVLVTGGPGWVGAARDPELIAYLKRQPNHATCVASICTGAMILAEAGLLDGRTATTKSQVFDGETAPIDMLAERDGVETAPGPIVDGGRVVTGGGVTLGIDAMFYLLARHSGAELAADVARVMEYDRALAANGVTLPGS